MKDTYKYDSVGVFQIIGTLRQTRESYEEKILELTNLANEIASSPAWKDVNVKAEFMNTYNSYLVIYRDAYARMARYEKYLENKAESARQIEQDYAR